ncbi:MAG: hypothetical protein WC254_00125 [Candidatus Woesearchaeota archaeon]
MSDVISKNILDVIDKQSSPQIIKQEITTETKPKKGTVVKKKVTTYSTKQTKKVIKKSIKKPIKQVVIIKSQKKIGKSVPLKHVRDLKKNMSSLSKQVKKRETDLQKKFDVHMDQMQQVQQDVLETKAHYQHIPKLTLETQVLIESMNKLTAVVKQMVVLFNQKMDAEDGPLFVKLGEITEQNEKIAEAILTVAGLVNEKQTPPAVIKDFNPYMQRMGPEPMQIRPQMPLPSEPMQVPPDFGNYSNQQQQEQPQPMRQYNAPLPPFTSVPQQEQPISRKRMLF